MIKEQLHELTHQVPGVPAHSDTANENVNPKHVHADGRHERRAWQGRQLAGDPRVFVRWQNWIASLGSRSRS